MIESSVTPSSRPSNTWTPSSWSRTPGDSLYEFRRLHRTMLSEVQGAGLSDLARLILSRTGAWQEIDAMPTPSDLSARLNVHRFLRLHRTLEPTRRRVIAGSLSRPAGSDKQQSGRRARHRPDRGRGRRGPDDRPSGKGSGVASGVSPGPLSRQLPGLAARAARSLPVRLHRSGPTYGSTPSSRNTSIPPSTRRPAGIGSGADTTTRSGGWPTWPPPEPRNTCTSAVLTGTGSRSPTRSLPSRATS